MRNDDEFKSELEKSLSGIAAPASLYHFAKEVPAIYEGQQNSPAARREHSRKSKLFSMAFQSALAIVILTGSFAVGIFTSPAFAAYMKGVPGFDIAVDWLTELRDRDGVQIAMEHGYTPIEARTEQFGGTIITISDVYLTDDELLFKAFIRTNEYDVTDQKSGVHIVVKPKNLLGGGSTTHHSVTESTDGSKAPIQQDTYKFHLSENVAREFLQREKKLIFEVTKLTFNEEKKRPEYQTLGNIALPIDQSKLLHNKVYGLNQVLPIAASDPDWTQLTLKKLTIQPTTMNAVIAGKQDWTLSFPREDGEAPYLKDEEGNVYPYDPSGPVLMLEGGEIQLSFMSSVFFEEEVKALQLHIGTVFVTELESSGSFELSKKDVFPKSLQFKNRTIVIEGAEFQEDYIRLRVRKEDPDQNVLEGIRFYNPRFELEIEKNIELGSKIDALREELRIIGWERAESYGSDPAYLEVYIPAPTQDSYTISLQRVDDPIVVNQDYPIMLSSNE
jgi:hypothetical protein